MTKVKIMGTTAPSIFSVPFGVPFFETVVNHVLSEVGNDPLVLSDVVIVLPSPRMATGLKNAFLKRLGGSAILPNIRTLSFSEDDMDVLRFEEELSANTLSPLARLMVLAHLVKAKAPDLPYTQILDEAWQLGQVFQRFSAYNITLEKVVDVLPDELAEAWKDNLDFLKIACQLYPNWLENEGKIDASVASQTLMRDLVKRHLKNPKRLLAVGFSDTTPVGQAVLKDIAEHAVGQIIFPPLEVMDTPASPTHPLFSLYKLMDVIGVQAKNITFLGGEEKSSFIPCDNLTFVEAHSAQEEAETIALMMRETLQHPNKTCALIAPDRTLAQRVCAALRYFDVDVDDSAGTPLSATHIGTATLAFLTMVMGRFDAVSVASFLFHPMVKKMQGLAVFDTYVLQGVAPAYGLAGLRHKLMQSRANDEKTERCLDIIDTLEQTSAWAVEGGKKSLPHIIEHILNTLRFYVPEEHLEGDDVGALVQLLSQWRAEAEYVPEMDLGIFTRTLEKMMEKVVVRKRYGAHPRLFVWGAMEARLQQVDRVIIAGLNEGVWPRKIKADPWLNRNMSAQLGLMDTLGYVGLSAYDWLHLSHIKDVFWTRTVRDNEGETVPSRFLMQYQAQLSAGQFINMKNRGEIWRSRSEKLRTEGAIHALSAPHINVPNEKRPNMWSPSLLSKYMACPYQVFVEKVLKIEKPDPYAEDPSAADKGQLIHLCLEAMVKQTAGLPAPFTGDWHDATAVEAHLLTIGEVAFGRMEHEGRKAVWWQKFKRLARGFAEEMARLPNRRIQAVETKLEADLNNGIHLKARVDRLDVDTQGQLYILDYKTGLIPSWVQVSKGFAPQMGVEAVLAKKAGHMLGDLEYWAVKGERNENVVRKAYSFSKYSLEKLQSEAEQGLEDLAETLTAESFAYRAIPGSPSAQDKEGACKNCDYAGLCRYKDWVEK